MTEPTIKDAIISGTTALGIELGSTRIKAVLIGPDHRPIATGMHDWENQFVERMWTYSIDEVHEGLQRCFASLAADVRAQYGVELESVGMMCVSAMMHGYIALDADGNLLVPFRTWRNTTTGPAAAELIDLFGYNIPLRWSIAHLRQAMLDGEAHVPHVAHVMTLGAYVHWKLTGENVTGVGDASGMFPVDTKTHTYDATMARKFDELVAAAGHTWRFADVMPRTLVAGEPAGVLTPEGAALLDPTGTFRPGVPLCPPEGDADTGMVATNSVTQRTGNVSAGTSVFELIVLEHELQNVYPEIDMLATPAGDLAALIHSNNGSSELDAWVGVFGEMAAALGVAATPAQLYEAAYRASLDGDPDCGGLLAYNYLAGEPVTGLEEGRPLIVRTPDSTLNLANFMRAQLFALFAVLRVGKELLEPEGVRIDRMFGHGGIFKTAGVAQRYLALALDVPVSVGDLAGEGGAWGAALLAAYARDNGGLTLSDYLNQRVFADAGLTTITPDPAEVAGYDAYMKRYMDGLAMEHAATK